MSPREELQALRRLAELEARAASAQPATPMAPPGQIPGAGPYRAPPEQLPGPRSNPLVDIPAGAVRGAGSIGSVLVEASRTAMPESMGGALSDVAGNAANWTQSSGQQQVEQARRDFINAILRRESGAVIGAGEFRNAEAQYFPQMGDSDAVKKQKADNRRLAVRGILAEVPKSGREAMAPTTPAAPQRTITVDW